MLDTFRARVIDLRRRGIVARDLSGRSVARALDESMMGCIHSVLHSLVVALAVLGSGFFLAAVGLISTGHWIANASERTIVEGVRGSAVDVVNLSAADIAARLRYSSEEGRILVDLARGEGRTMIEETAAALSLVPLDHRREGFKRVLQVAEAATMHPSKGAFVDWALSLDDAAAWSIVKFGGPISDVLRRLSNMTPQEIHTIVTSDFRIQPLDETRARLWSMINDRRFPASALVEPLAELSSTSPDRLEYVKRYLYEKAPLPSCRPTACRPVACSLAGVSCPTGYRPTMGQPVCVAYNPDDWAR